MHTTMKAALQAAAARLSVGLCHRHTIRSSVSHLSAAALDLACEPETVHSRSPRKAQSVYEMRRDARNFLQQVRERKIPDEMAGLQARVHLIGLANKQPSTQNGPLASSILNTITQLDSVKRDRYLAAKLHCLTMELWIKSGHKRALDEAERIFWKLLREKEALLTHDLKKNVYTYNDAFCLIVNALTIETGRRQLPMSSVRRVENIVQAMQELWKDPNIRLTPNTPAINAILYVLMKERNHIKARMVLEGMLRAWRRGDASLKPNRSSFNTVIIGCAKAGEPDLAISVIQTMMALHEKDDTLPYPNSYAFTALLNGFARSKRPDAGDRAEKVLEWIQELHNQGKPVIVEGSMTYNVNSVMQAWANSGQIGAARRAETILKQVLDLYKNGRRDVPPDHLSFWTVINAWHLSREEERGERAEAVVSWMEELYRSQGWDVLQTEYVYRECIHVWLTSGHPHAGSKATTMIEHMKTLGLAVEETEKLVDRWHRSRLGPAN